MTANESFVASLGDNGISNYWRLCEELTVRQAAFLIVGIDPDSETGVKSRDWRKDERPAGYGAAIQALTSQLRASVITGTHVQEIETDMNGNPIGEIDGSTDVDRSTVNTDSVAKWLQGKGYKTGFFFPDDGGAPDYMNSKDARYAPKLAAAVSAWQAVTTAGKTSPKQALAKWLREHAATYGLSDDEGKPNETGIEEVAKVANWQPTGGAAKTPGD